MFPPDCWDPPATSSHARKCVQAKKTIRPPDCWDPPATSSQARKCLTVGTHLVEAYVGLSFWSRTCMYILVIVQARTCRSRGAHVACTRTYIGQGARKKIRPHMCTYRRGLERLLAHTYGQGSCTWLGGNGETSSSSCSWGGNGMRRVHGEATKRVVFIGRQRNAWEPIGLDGTGDGNEAWRTAERRKRPCVRPATFETGSCSSGGVWRTAKRRKRTSYGRNGGPIDWEGCGVP